MAFTVTAPRARGGRPRRVVDDSEFAEKFARLQARHHGQPFGAVLDQFDRALEDLKGPQALVALVIDGFAVAKDFGDGSQSAVPLSWERPFWTVLRDAL